MCIRDSAERVCALSVSVHPGCPSLPWSRGFGLGIKLGACRPIVWTAEARMNLERSSAQIVRSSGKFRAVFCKVRSIEFLQGDFLSEFGPNDFYRKHTNIQNTRFPSGKRLGEWRKNETKSIQRETNTCLLYTSPSPRDATLSRMPSSA